jgi:hypothetical protein
MSAGNGYGDRPEFDELIKPSKLRKKDTGEKPDSAGDKEPRIEEEQGKKKDLPPPDAMLTPRKTTGEKPVPEGEGKQPQITEKHIKPESPWQKIKDIFWILLLIASALTLIFINVKRFTKKHIPAQKPKLEFKKPKVEKKTPPLTREMLKSQTEDVTSFILRIVGSASFEKNVREGLKLIFVYDREMFDDLKEHIYVIREDVKTDFVVEEGAPKILLTRKTATLSPTWCAGAIAHQLFLAKNYYEQKRRERAWELPPPGQEPELKVEANPNIVKMIRPLEVENLERKADDYQVVLMIKAGAPTYEIKLIKNRKPGDYSLTHDGRY